MHRCDPHRHARTLDRVSAIVANLYGEFRLEPCCSRHRPTIVLYNEHGGRLGHLARELGGRGYALLLSAVCALVAPQYLSNGSLLGTNCLEPIFWMGCAYFAILAIKRNDPRYWLWFGVVAGIGLEEKYSIDVFGLGIVVGLLLTEQRRVFLNKWIWIGGLAAFLIFLPNLLWNAHYHWPFVQLMHNIRAEGRDVVLPAWQYFFQQTLLVGFITAPIWLAGLIGFFAWPRLK